MKITRYNKLVRDNIPKIIENAGKKPKVCQVNGDLYYKMLCSKLEEECNEFLESNEIEELADILEVIYSIAKVKGISQEELESIRIEKKNRRGGFDDRVMLLEVVEE